MVKLVQWADGIRRGWWKHELLDTSKIIYWWTPKFAPSYCKFATRETALQAWLKTPASPSWSHKVLEEL